MNVEGTNYFSDDGEDGILEVRYIREYGLCICTKHEGKNYFFPMIAMEDKASFSNVFSDIVSDYDVKLKQAIKGLNEHKEKEIIVICRSGNRSQTGTRILISHGFNAVNMLGGMKAWNDLQ